MFWVNCLHFMMFSNGGSDSKGSARIVGNLGSIPEAEMSSGGGHGNTLEYSFLGDPHGQRSLGDYSLLGHKKVGHD